VGAVTLRTNAARVLAGKDLISAARAAVADLVED
jgi:hypothetical protein